MDSGMFGKKVHVMLGRKLLHKGILLSADKVFKDTFLIGVTETTIPNVTKLEGKQYISIFRAKERQIKFI